MGQRACTAALGPCGLDWVGDPAGVGAGPIFLVYLGYSLWEISWLASRAALDSRLQRSPGWLAEAFGWPH